MLLAVLASRESGGSPDLYPGDLIAILTDAELIEVTVAAVGLTDAGVDAVLVWPVPLGCRLFNGGAWMLHKWRKKDIIIGGGGEIMIRPASVPLVGHVPGPVGLPWWRDARVRMVARRARVTLAHD
jgi:hypothetical protein